ncbi:hypothetical protein RFI_28714 [Reticulomyxa filosa]|uniref:Uncharacterized protein n=1 Tax=Reticulomyxa filosa TaxID=46433 RepID=X6M5C7_RETFI|nr:hypothetical protein RFI_28714 [Reticulomyxa filosa]|eukprot:ETO08672.1 hypothetical protein RFI_28714 [Reticulomyxa filosa]
MKPILPILRREYDEATLMSLSNQIDSSNSNGRDFFDPIAFKAKENEELQLLPQSGSDTADSNTRSTVMSLHDSNTQNGRSNRDTDTEHERDMSSKKERVESFDEPKDGHEEEEEEEEEEEKEVDKMSRAKTNDKPTPSIRPSADTNSSDWNSDQSNTHPANPKHQQKLSHVNQPNLSNPYSVSTTATMDRMNSAEIARLKLRKDGEHSVQYDSDSYAGSVQASQVAPSHNLIHSPAVESNLSQTLQDQNSEKVLFCHPVLFCFFFLFFIASKSLFCLFATSVDSNFVMVDIDGTTQASNKPSNIATVRNSWTVQSNSVVSNPAGLMLRQDSLGTTTSGHNANPPNNHNKVSADNSNGIAYNQHVKNNHTPASLVGTVTTTKKPNIKMTNPSTTAKHRHVNVAEAADNEKQDQESIASPKIREPLSLYQLSQLAIVQDDKKGNEQRNEC